MLLVLMMVAASVNRVVPDELFFTFLNFRQENLWEFNCSHRSSDPLEFL